MIRRERVKLLVINASLLAACLFSAVSQQIKVVAIHGTTIVAAATVLYYCGI